MANPPTGYWDELSAGKREFVQSLMRSGLIQYGVAANKPTAGDLAGEGVVYYETDTGLLKRYSGSAWEYVGAIPLYGTIGSRPTGEEGMEYLATDEEGGTYYLYTTSWTKVALAVAEPAGGQLGGTYPNPTVDSSHSGSAHHTQDHDTRHEPGGGDAMAVDAVVATGSLRTLGTGAQQAAVGSHDHIISEDANAGGIRQGSSSGSMSFWDYVDSANPKTATAAVAVGASAKLIGVGVTILRQILSGTTTRELIIDGVQVSSSASGSAGGVVLRGSRDVSSGTRNVDSKVSTDNVTGTHTMCYSGGMSIVIS